MKVLGIIERYKNGNVKVLAEVTCDRCYGEKQFKHILVDNGICYKCNGLGVVEKRIIQKTPENIEKDRRKKESQLKKKEELRQKNQLEFEKAEKVREKQRADKSSVIEKINKPFYELTRPYLRLLDRTPFITSYFKNLKEELKHREIYNISDRQKEILADIIAKTQGNRNTKAYKSLYEQILNFMYKN